MALSPARDQPSRMSSALYIVRPLPGGLYELTGPTLPYPLRFKDDAAPLNYAQFAGRGQVGEAIVLSRCGRGPVLRMAGSSCGARGRFNVRVSAAPRP